MKLFQRERAMADNAEKHRDKMKAAGVKPVTIWVPDVDAPGYGEQVAEAIAIINGSPGEKEMLEELSNVEIEGWK
jgi:hypothetical protein